MYLIILHSVQTRWLLLFFTIFVSKCSISLIPPSVDTLLIYCLWLNFLFYQKCWLCISDSTMFPISVNTCVNPSSVEGNELLISRISSLSTLVYYTVLIESLKYDFCLLQFTCFCLPPLSLQVAVIRAY